MTDNITTVRNQIYDKLNSCQIPHYGTINEAKKTITDFDHFPYTRFFRGIYESSEPVVIEREAGWRPVDNQCYKPNICKEEQAYPNHCFESGCSVVYPCYPNYINKIADRDALNVQLNKSCIVQYR